ncbi:shufflon system plasmid conjugative transfer pilus tip adhesin PilV [Pectobacterium fontis]|uniref:shufflon system plasmid conjugative transfer pilus tip adhesin PilV n=1 Tax=Pectobacterium fontis TaxID=2558042 RepID=UPI000B08CDD5
MAFMKFQDMKKDQENILANTVGAQMKQMGDAVNRYISIRYDKLSTLSSSSSQTSDPGPRTCSAAGCEITYQTLVNEGLLPAGHTGINMQKSSYKILLKRAGTTPNYVINGLVITTLPWSEGNRIRYDLLGRAMQAAGIDSGMTQFATVASGTGGQWTESQNNYSGINAAGLLAYRVGYDSAMYSVYLRRDGTLPMTGSLNMGQNDINNVKNITASGDIIASGNITGDYLQATAISVVGEVCASDGLISRDAKGMVLSCQNGKWKAIGGGSITRTATDKITVSSPGNFDFINVSLATLFNHRDGSHTTSANFNVYVNSTLIGKMTTYIYVEKGGSSGHYWGYQKTGVDAQMFKHAVNQGDVISVELDSAYLAIKTDIIVSLSQ